LRKCCSWTCICPAASSPRWSRWSCSTIRSKTSVWFGSTVAVAMNRWSDEGEVPHAPALSRAALHSKASREPPQETPSAMARPAGARHWNQEGGVAGSRSGLPDFRGRGNAGSGAKHVKTYIASTARLRIDRRRLRQCAFLSSPASCSIDTSCRELGRTASSTRLSFCALSSLPVRGVRDSEILFSAESGTKTRTLKRTEDPEPPRIDGLRTGPTFINYPGDYQARGSSSSASR
jgi:hypothetical protein